MKDNSHNESRSKQSCLDIGFREVSIGVAPQYDQVLRNDMQGKRKQHGLKHHVSSTMHGVMGDASPFMASQISSCDSSFSMWDKGQLAMILSRSDYAKNSIFIGPKNDTLDALTQLLLKKTQWTDYIENVLEIVAINRIENNNISDESNEQVLHHNTCLFRICDSQLPAVSSGCARMSVSLHHPNHTCVGTTKNICSRLQMHNSENGAIDTALAHLHPFALLACVCGFTGSNNSALCFYIENKWKERRDYLISQDNNSVKSWAYCGNHAISNECGNNEYFGIERNELRLVCVFVSNR